MSGLLDSLGNAIDLLLSGDDALWEIVWLTLRVTGAALILATILGIPLGAALGLSRRVPLRGLLIPIIYTGMGLPPVVVGLFVCIVLWFLALIWLEYRDKMGDGCRNSNTRIAFGLHVKDEGVINDSRNNHVIIEPEGQ